jgi:trehalose/maltose hydrolase-like predicted phosphorylase
LPVRSAPVVLLVTVAVFGGAPASAALAAGACPSGQDGAGWTLSTTTYGTASTRHPYVGNGYLSQRVPPAGMGYMATGEKTGWPLYTPRYDGAFVGGLYGRDPLIVDADGQSRTIDSAIPTWSTLSVTAGGDTFSPTTPAGRISNFKQSLYLGCGLLRTSLTWTAADGKVTDLAYDVIASRDRMHVGAVHLSMTPRWSGTATVADVIDGAGARRLLQTGGGAWRGGPTVDVTFETQSIGTPGAVASTLSYGAGVQPSSDKRTAKAQNLTASRTVSFPVTARTTYQLTKFVGVDTALTSAKPEADAVAASQSAAARGWSGLLADHAATWAKLWTSDIEVGGNAELQEWVRSNLYALLSSIRGGTDNSISPVGLSSDNYAGLVFWDAETWMYPSLLLMHPDIADAVVAYREKTLPGARTNAVNLGYKGLFYPWNGAGTGDLASECHSVSPPHCVTQIHLQGDIALSVWQYYQATGDLNWLRSRWNILKGNAEFWAGRVTANGDGTYSINNVAGPDEYSNGVNDGVFTNAGAATALRNATKAAKLLGESAPASWTAIADHLRMPFDSANQVFRQYDGYAGTLIKQADTVLLIYPLEWSMSADVAAKTLDYYAERTDPDGPAMTDSVHAIDAAQIGAPGCATYTYLRRSITPFIRDPFAQFAEARGDKAGAQDPLAGAPAFDFLTGSGGFSQVFTYGLTGLRWRDDGIRLDPMLPPQLSGGVTLRGLHWHGSTFDVKIGAASTTVTVRSGDPLPVDARGTRQVIRSGGSLSLTTRRPDLAAPANLALCKPGTATSEEAGMYADAAVDGSHATIWAPADATASLTVDLRAKVQVGRIAVTWTDTLPATSSVQVSADGKAWTTVAPAADGSLASAVTARYVRVTMTRADTAPRTGIREVAVNAPTA